MILNYGQALAQGLGQAMDHDPTVIVMGIGVDDHKSVFGSTEGILRRFGPDRIFDTPLAEAAMTGVAIGAALGGLKPVHIHIRADFLYLAMDQLLNLAAKWHYMFGEQSSVPIVVRAVIGRSWGQGAQHSQSLPSFFMHVPGIKVAMPTTPADAKGLLMAAIADPNPVILFEHRLLYYLKGDVPERPYETAIGPAVIRRAGKDLTIIANSYMAVEALKAAEFLETQNISVEIVDPVTLVPLDKETILKSVLKTKKALIIDTSWVTCGVSAEIAAMLAEDAFEALSCPVRRMGNQPVTCPVSKPLENEFYPSARKIAAAVLGMMGRETSGAAVGPLMSPFKGPF